MGNEKLSSRTLLHNLFQVINYSEIMIKAMDAVPGKLHIHTIAHGLIEDLWTFQRLSSDFRLKNPDPK